MWNLKNNTNKSIQNRNRLTDIEVFYLIVTKGEGVGEINSEYGIKKTTTHKIGKQQEFTV